MSNVPMSLFRSPAPGLCLPVTRWAALCLTLVGASPVLARDAAARLEFAPYAFETQKHGTIAAEAGYLEVPRRHADPNGPRMRLRVVRLQQPGHKPG